MYAYLHPIGPPAAEKIRRRLGGHSSFLPNFLHTHFDTLRVNADAFTNAIARQCQQILSSGLRGMDYLARYLRLVKSAKRREKMLDNPGFLFWLLGSNTNACLIHTRCDKQLAVALLCRRPAPDSDAMRCDAITDNSATRRRRANSLARAELRSSRTSRRTRKRSHPEAVLTCDCDLHRPAPGWLSGRVNFYLRLTRVPMALPISSWALQYVRGCRSLVHSPFPVFTPAVGASVNGLGPARTGFRTMYIRPREDHPHATWCGALPMAFFAWDYGITRNPSVRTHLALDRNLNSPSLAVLVPDPRRVAIGLCTQSIGRRPTPTRSCVSRSIWGSRPTAPREWHKNPDADSHSVDLISPRGSGATNSISLSVNVPYEIFDLHRPFG
ncbi:hypothetical protein B0H11DRAFT_2196007 [Mycena galericulata]|nr:hypothetical protein B0H11DRAFT_2196007 [Mycena galericulata]